jgi:hypothetical protein
LLRVSVVTRQHAAELQHLRRAAYLQAKEFVWHDPAALGWVEADDAGAVLGVWDEEGLLVSSMRASVMHGAADAEGFLEYSLAGADARFPALVLSRAATLPERSAQGFMAWIRLAYLSALPSTSIESVIAVVYDGGPRVRAMQAAGYTLHEPQRAWDSEATALSRPVLAILRRARFEAAQATVLAGMVDQLSRVRIDVDAIGGALEPAAALASFGIDSPTPRDD